MVDFSLFIYSFFLDFLFFRCVLFDSRAIFGAETQGSSSERINMYRRYIGGRVIGRGKPPRSLLLMVFKFRNISMSFSANAQREK